jgi:hypothetical protein
LAQTHPSIGSIRCASAPAPGVHRLVQ